MRATYVLIHGAGSDAWYWHQVVPRLEALGHDVVPVDLPCDDDAAGLEEYADAVVEALGDRADLILVAQSLGGFTAPLVAARVRVRLMVLVAAMVPRPGESAGEWWANTGHVFPEPFDPAEVFTHDVPADVVAASVDHLRAQSGTPFERPWPLDAWPDVPTRFLLCRDDRFFPPSFLRPVVRERLGIEPDEMSGGHLPALAHPDELVDWLERYRAGLDEGLERAVRKIDLMLSISIDGCIAGPNGELGWHLVDDELHRHFNDVLGAMSAFPDKMGYIVHRWIGLDRGITWLRYLRGEPRDHHA